MMNRILQTHQDFFTDETKNQERFMLVQTQSHGKLHRLALTYKSRVGSCPTQVEVREEVVLVYFYYSLCYNKFLPTKVL